MAGYFGGLYADYVQLDWRTGNWFRDMYAMLDLWGSALIFVTGIFFSYFFGGYLAGKLSPYRYLAPYSHAAVGSFAFVMISQGVFQFFKVCECGPPTLDDVGRIALTVPITLGLSLGGTWVSTHTEAAKRVDSLARAFSDDIKTQFSRNKEFDLVSEKPKINSTLAEAGSIPLKQAKSRVGSKRSKRSRHKGRKG